MYFYKDKELFLYLRNMKENVPVIYAAPLQGFTEAAWRNAHAQCLGGVDAYYTPFVRLEKGEIRNKDRRDVSPEENTVPRLVPQVIASEPEELKVLTDFLASQGYREIEGGKGAAAGQAEDLLGVPVAGAGQETAEGYLEEQSPGRVSAGSGRGIAGINHPSFFLKYSYPMRQNRHFLVSQ